MAERVHADTEEGKEEARAILNEIWDMPAEYEALGLLEGLTEEERRQPERSWKGFLGKYTGDRLQVWVLLLCTRALCEHSMPFSQSRTQKGYFEKAKKFARKKGHA